MSDETVLCPDCRWTGQKSDLDASGGSHSCPVCDMDIRVE